ncbi:MAG: SH3 domain-containing protein [Chloroflexota bacterium]
MRQCSITTWRPIGRVGFIIILLLCIAPAQAQQELLIGESATAQLTATASQIGFVFEGTPNSPVQIDIIAIDDGLALQAVVLDPAGNLALAISNDGTANRVRGTLTTLQTGQYTIFVNDINGNTGTFVISLTGEATCEAVIENVLRSAQEACTGTARNEVCIGGPTVDGVLRAGIQPLPFSELGDRVPVTALETLNLSPLDTNARELGTALLQLQANLPDTLPGQNVTLLLFGGVEVTNRTTTEPDLAGIYNPMQAFYLRPGLGTAQCESAPAEGVVITTPEEDALITFNINGVDVALGSTALLTLDQATGLQIAMLEGSAVVSADGGAQVVVAGQQVAVPVDANFEAAGPPAPPEPIAPGAPVLPIDIIEQPVTSPTPVSTLPAPPTVSPLIPTATPGRPPLPVSGGCVIRTADADVAVNVRTGPGVEFEAVASLVTTDVRNVVGRNQNGSWYQTDIGWVAASVTELGGNCNGLPITFIPPTATPTPTLAPPTLPPVITPLPTQPSGGVDIPNLCDDFGTNLNISAGSVGVVANLSQEISFGTDCSGSYTVRYTLLDVRQFPERELRWSITCSGDGAGFLEIGFSDGTSAPCTSSAYNFRSSVGRGDDFFVVRYSFLPGGSGVTDISVVMSILE